MTNPAIASQISKYADTAVIYSQGDPAPEVLYIQHGTVKLAVISTRGTEAVVGRRRAAVSKRITARNPKAGRSI